MTSASEPVSTKPGCEGNLTCYSWCGAEDSCFNVTIQYHEEFIDIDMRFGKFNPEEKWIGVGLSKDKTMGDDSVIECVLTENGVEVFNSYNDGYQNVRIGKTGILQESGWAIDGIIRCSAIRKLTITDQRIFDLRSDTEFYLLLASGRSSGNEISQHTNTPHISPVKIDLKVAGSIVQEGTTTNRRLSVLRAHGSLMLIAWVFTTSIGIIVARYYKLLGGNTTFNNDRYSFHIHRACMTITLICVTVSFILIFVEVGGFSQVGGTNSLIIQAHPVLGIIVAALVWLNFSMGMLRPAPGRTVRPLYNWGHWATGTGAWITAMITIFLGFAMPQAAVHPAAKYLMIGFVGIHLLVQLFLEWLSCHVEKSPMDEKPEQPRPVIHEMTTMDSQNGRAQGVFDLQEESVSGVGQLKAFVLFAYGFILLCVVFALILLVNK